MSSYWEEIRRLREGEQDDAADELAFDREYLRRFGRLPPGSRLQVDEPVDDPRRQAIEALVERGATEGERAAAQAALERLGYGDPVGEFPSEYFDQDDPFEED